MSSIRIKSRMHETMQEFIETNKLGYKLARAKLGKTPNSIVIEKISSLDKLGRTGILLVNVKFNSDEGPFEGMLAIKQFETPEEAQRLVKINKWLSKRIENNPRVFIPKIYSAGGNSIVYEGINGLSYEESKGSTVKLRMAANAIATFHTAYTYPVNVKRYEIIVNKAIKELPITDDRKEKLITFATSYLTYYRKENSGTISYGDFHPGNIILSRDNETSYLIDPEFVEDEPGADRFEDVSNFLVFDAYMEFLNNERLTKTFEKLEIFLDGYDSFLQHYETSLGMIYGNTHWLALIFHLGLISLLKGAVAVQEVKRGESPNEVDLVVQTEIEEIIQSYRLTREIWSVGVQYLPENSIPRILNKKPTDDGYLMTWPIIHDILIDVLKKDPILGMLFKFPPTIKEITLEAGIELYKVSDKKELQSKVAELESYVKFNTFMIKDSIEINIAWKTLMGISTTPEINWKENCEILYRIWRKIPLNLFISIMTLFLSVSVEEFEKGAIFDKKNLKEVLKQAEEMKIINMTKENIKLNSKWREILGLSPQFNPSYFN